MIQTKSRTGLKRPSKLALLCAVALPAVLAMTPVAAKTLVFCSEGSPENFYPGINTTGTSFDANSQIYSRLVEFERGGTTVVPGLAESWTISPDGKTYTFNLEPKAKWHDGKPLTSEDVIYTAMEFLPLTHPRAKAIFGRCESITAPDAHTVVFKLKEPFGPFIGAFDISNLPVMPKHIYAGTDVVKNPANLNPIGSGPFKLKEWVRGSHIHLVRNDDYFKPGLPYLDAIIYRVIPDGAGVDVLGHHRQVRDVEGADEGAEGLLELEDHGVRVGCGDRFAASEQGLGARVRERQEFHRRVDHVFGRQRLAVVPLGLGLEVEGVGLAVRRDGPAPGQAGHRLEVDVVGQEAQEDLARHHLRRRELAHGQVQDRRFGLDDGVERAAPDAARSLGEGLRQAQGEFGQAQGAARQQQLVEFALLHECPWERRRGAAHWQCGGRRKANSV